ncbi:Dgk1p [Saccharomyces cerevisiae x Saccharomyces kudriavzevii VIN7]|uniref:Dgk1p n=1 Tax=Saccharomyces cerevisiae x Saccharomyces kudriavzevii (strain VIN7) TaxID=1095631 RepID=H0H1J0_SACCK|nr:Dgk1p [Saccharomyces cerevisiae x Saccharomyces kudriavzevii VIN7]
MGNDDGFALSSSTLEPRTEVKQRLFSKSHQDLAKETCPAKDESSSDDDAHVPVTEIHLKSHEWFGDFITKHEIPRKVFHSSIGFITLYLYTQGINYKDVLWPLIYGFIIMFILDLIRLNWPFFNILYCRTVGALMRKKEIHTYNGVLWYILGLIFSF